MKNILFFIIGALLFSALSVQAISVFQGYQGGTGYSSTTIGNVGKCFYVSSSDPLVLDFTACAGSSGLSDGAWTSSSISIYPTNLTKIIGIGTTTATTSFPGTQPYLIMATGTEQQFEYYTDGSFEGKVNGNAAYAINSYIGASAGESFFIVAKASGTIASPAALLSDSRIGEINFSGWDTNRSSAAVIRGEADADFGTAGDATDAPGRLLFMTTPDGSGTLSERMRITSNGLVGVGTTTPQVLLVVATTSEALRIGDGSNTATYFSMAGQRVFYGYDGSDALIQGGTSRGIKFIANDPTFGGTANMYITTTGLVGINTSTPAYNLTISGTAGFSDGSNVNTFIRRLDSFEIEYPTSTVGFEKVIRLMPESTTTITKVKAINKDAGSSWIFNFLIGTDYSAATSTMNLVFTSYQTANSTTTIQSFTPNGSTTIPIGSFLMLDGATASSTRIVIEVYGY